MNVDGCLTFCVVHSVDCTGSNYLFLWVSICFTGDNASVLTEEDCERAMAAPSPPNKSPASSSPAESVTERADESDKENAIPHNFMPESDAERAKESDTENADESDKENADQDADEFDQENADREQQRVNKYGSQNRSKSGRKALKQLNIV